MVGWSCREAGDRYRRVASGGNEKIKGVAAIVSWEVDVVDKVEIRQKRKELSCLRVRRFITGMLKSFWKLAKCFSDFS